VSSSPLTHPLNSAPAHEHHARRILDAVEANDHISQRTLASQLGIALGLTNLLVRRLVRKGLLRAINVKPNRVRYLITPAGIAEKARMSRAYFDYTLSFYRQTRTRIQERFSTLADQDARVRVAVEPTRIVFWGAGEVAEIAYVCLAETDLQLIGVVESKRQNPFFNTPVHRPVALTGLYLAGEPFDWLVVTSFGESGTRAPEIAASGVPSNRVFTI